MKTRVTVLSSERRENTYEGNRKSVSHKCKVIIHKADGSVDVGTLSVPDALAPAPAVAGEHAVVVPGDYAIDYAAGRGFSEDKVIGVLCLFELMGKPSVPVAGPQPVKAPEGKA